MSYTNGPWKVQKKREGRIPIEVVAEARYIVKEDFCDVFGNTDDDARLISKAPELLETLEQVLDMWGLDYSIYEDELYNKAWKLVNETKGE